MKKIALLATSLALAFTAPVVLAAELAEEAMGLSKTSVYDTPEPQVFEYGSTAPFSGKVLPRAYLGAPPQVPHDISDMVPITRDNNMCVGCHQQPDRVGKKKVKGQPTPLPASHYADVKSNTMHMGRYNCTQCHTPQATVKPLVENTFKPRPR